MNTPIDVLKEYLDGITEVKETAEGNDLKEISRIETMFKMSIRWQEFLLGFPYKRNGITLTKKEIEKKLYQKEYWIERNIKYKKELKNKKELK